MVWDIQSRGFIVGGHGYPQVSAQHWTAVTCWSRMCRDRRSRYTRLLYAGLNIYTFCGYIRLTTRVWERTTKGSFIFWWDARSVKCPPANESISRHLRSEGWLKWISKLSISFLGCTLWQTALRPPLYVIFPPVSFPTVCSPFIDFSFNFGFHKSDMYFNVAKIHLLPFFILSALFSQHLSYLGFLPAPPPMKYVLFFCTSKFSSVPTWLPIYFFVGNAKPCSILNIHSARQHSLLM